MLCKVNWSAECLLTNYFSEVVSINCYNILCYQFVVLSLISSKEKKKKDVRKKAGMKYHPGHLHPSLVF